MPDNISQLIDIWSCPYCQSEFENNFYCKSCNISFPVNEDKPDLRLKKAIDIQLTYHYTPEFGYFPWDKMELEWLPLGNNMQNEFKMDYTEFSMLSYVAPAEKGQYALDFGCGVNKARFEKGLERLGYVYVGIDIEGPAPTAYADAHSLPFKDGTFDLIMSSAVFEHLKNPYAAMKELRRVAKPGAKIILSIAYMEPFHISYFHHSMLAVHELLTVNDIHPEKFITSAKWNSFNSNLFMGFAGTYMPAFLQRVISGSIMGYSLIFARIKGVIKNDKTRLNKARLAFARSHSGIVGVVAYRS